MAQNWKPENLCKHCACNPCQCHTHEQKRAAGKERYDERTTSRPEPKKKASKATKKAPKKSKKAFIKAYKSKHPTASQSDINSALKKAGYPTGCLSVIVLIFVLPPTGFGYGVYEMVGLIFS